MSARSTASTVNSTGTGPGPRPPHQGRPSGFSKGKDGGPGGGAGGGGSGGGQGGQYVRNRTNTSGSNHSSSGPGPSNGAQGPPAGSSINATSTPPLHLSSLLGIELKLVLNTSLAPPGKGKDAAAAAGAPGVEVRGVLWCYDSQMGSLVLANSLNPNTAPSSFRIVRLAAIQCITAVPGGPVSPSVQDFESTMHPVDVGRVKEREEMAVARERRRIERAPPPGVSELGAELFEALGKTMPVRWAGKSMVVMDEVLIEPPYTPDSCKSPKDSEQRLNRVRKVLEGERSKLEGARPDLFTDA